LCDEAGGLLLCPGSAKYPSYLFGSGALGQEESYFSCLVLSPCISPVSQEDLNFLGMSFYGGEHKRGRVARMVVGRFICCGIDVGPFLIRASTAGVQPYQDTIIKAVSPSASLPFTKEVWPSKGTITSPLSLVAPHISTVLPLLSRTSKSAPDESI
jgi:hypothetical protein